MSEIWAESGSAPVYATAGLSTAAVARGIDLEATGSESHLFDVQRRRVPLHWQRKSRFETAGPFVVDSCVMA